MKLLSWNVNGIRACIRSESFQKVIRGVKPDILCVQETKARPEDVTYAPRGYQSYWHSAEKKGYSGTAVYSLIEPKSVSRGMGDREGDPEGRVLTLEFDEWYLVNVYTPNSQHELARLDFRMAWDKRFRTYVRKLAREKSVIFCGDLNVAHEEIDLANPKTNRRNPGFTDEERAQLTVTLKAGFVDTFRARHPEPDQYSWWSYRGDCRKRNIGWRIDYVCASGDLDPRIRDAFILPAYKGSDHCPVGIEL